MLMKNAHPKSWRITRQFCFPSVAKLSIIAGCLIGSSLKKTASFPSSSILYSSIKSSARWEKKKKKITHSSHLHSAFFFFFRLLRWRKRWWVKWVHRWGKVLSFFFPLVQLMAEDKNRTKRDERRCSVRARRRLVIGAPVLGAEVHKVCWGKRLLLL